MTSMARKKVDDSSAAATGQPWTSNLRPAPGDLRIVQAFVNTLGREKKTDEFASPQAFADWLARWRLADASMLLTPADLERKREVREALTVPIAEAAPRLCTPVRAGLDLGPGRCGTKRLREPVQPPGAVAVSPGWEAGEVLRET